MPARPQGPATEVTQRCGKTQATTLAQDNPSHCSILQGLEANARRHTHTHNISYSDNMGPHSQLHRQQRQPTSLLQTPVSNLWWLPACRCWCRHHRLIYSMSATAGTEHHDAACWLMQMRRRAAGTPLWPCCRRRHPRSCCCCCGGRWHAQCWPLCCRAA